MASVAVLFPVLGRPHRVEPLLASLRASEAVVALRPIFLCSPGDRDEIAAVRAAGEEPTVVAWKPEGGDWARKLNLGFRETTNEFVFLGADDLLFGHAWADNAVAVYERTHACVIGTNDLGNARVIAGYHSTHPLVHRGYGECGTIDDPAVILHEGYGHEFVDDEFVATARFRGTFAPALDAVVEHLHPDWQKGEWDATYEKGRASRWDDRALFEAREYMWGGRSSVVRRGTWS